MSISTGLPGRAVLGATIVGVAVVSVAVALVVVAAARPSDAALRRQVATDLGVPEPLLDVPLVDTLVDRAGAQAKASVLEELDTSLAMGALAGIATAVVLATGIVSLDRPQRSRDDPRSVPR
jgi:hypothetical protein